MTHVADLERDKAAGHMTMMTAAKTSTKSRTEALSNRHLGGSSVPTFQASPRRGALRLSGQGFKPDIAEPKAKLRSDLQIALAALQSAGIATPTGKLSKQLLEGRTLRPGRVRQQTPCARIASATLTKPAMLAPST